jgi:hypothetical protein
MAEVPVQPASQNMVDGELFMVPFPEPDFAIVRLYPFISQYPFEKRQKRTIKANKDSAKKNCNDFCIPFFIIPPSK